MMFRTVLVSLFTHSIWSWPRFPVVPTDLEKDIEFTKAATRKEPITRIGKQVDFLEAIYELGDISMSYRTSSPTNKNNIFERYHPTSYPMSKRFETTFSPTNKKNIFQTYRPNPNIPTRQPLRIEPTRKPSNIETNNPSLVAPQHTNTEGGVIETGNEEEPMKEITNAPTKLFSQSIIILKRSPSPTSNIFTHNYGVTETPSTFAPTSSPRTSITTIEPTFLTTMLFPSSEAEDSMIPTGLSLTTDMPSSKFSSYPSFLPSNPLCQDVLEVISQISSLEKLKEPSPQSQAFKWLTDTDSVSKSCSDNLVQRYVLAVFYYSLNGRNWKRNNFWLSSENECKWEGILCTNNSEYLRKLQLSNNPTIFQEVSEMNLDNNNMSGTLPTELAILSRLQQVQFSFNDIQGNISVINKKMPHLKLIDVHSNKLTGTIADAFFNNFPGLEKLRLSTNFFQGTLSSNIGQLSRLNELILSNNNFQGTLPSEEIGKLFFLEKIILFQNQFEGNIPSTIGNLKFLKWIDFSQNNFMGTLPQSFYKLEELELAYLYKNQLSGTINNNIGKLRNLIQLWLNENQFEGTLPKEIGALKYLETLQLYQNKFNGFLPSQSLSNITSLLYLDVSQNFLEGTLSDYFYSFKQINTVYLSKNRFTGSISKLISNLQNLQVLWLDHNQFEGQFPPVDISSMRKLQELLLQNNYFTGSIPKSVCALPDLEIFISDCQYPPKIICECCTSCS